MTRIFPCVALLSVAALSAAACGDDDIPAAAGVDAGSGGSAGRGGSGGAGVGGSSPTSAGTSGVGVSGAGGSAGRGGSAGAVDAGSVDAGSDAGAGDAGDAGVACTDPSCVCAVDAITAVPYTEQWQTTEEAEADVLDLEGCQLCDNTIDHIVTFTAPATATYRFFATSGGDVELTVYPGDCTATPNDLSCGEDLDPDNQDYNDQLDLPLIAGETVTVVVGESCEENGGTGTLAIDVAP